MHHRTDLDVFIIKAYKVLTLQRRGIADDEETGSLLSTSSSKNTNTNTGALYGSTDMMGSRNNSGFKNESSTIGGNPTTNSTLQGNNSERVVVIDLNDFKNSTGSSPYHQVGFTDNNENELFNKIAKLYNLIFLSESGSNPSFFNLDFEKDKHDDSSNEKVEITGESKITQDESNAQKQGINNKNEQFIKESSFASDSPKSAIELYQKFYQILRELDLNYEDCPYSKYFIKISANLLQIKSDNELIMDPVWKLITYKFFGNYKYIKLITKMVSSNQGKNTNNKQMFSTKSLTNASTGVSLSDTGEDSIQKYGNLNSAATSPSGLVDTPNTLQNTDIKMLKAAEYLPKNDVKTDSNNEVVTNTKESNRATGQYVLNKEVKQKVKKLQKERKSTRKGYFTTPTSPTTSWMNNFLTTSGINDLNDGFAQQTSSQEMQKSLGLPLYPPLHESDGIVSNSVLDENTIADFENTLMSLQAAHKSSGNGNDTETVVDDNNKHNLSSEYVGTGFALDPVTGTKQENSISASNINTMLFSNEATANKSYKNIQTQTVMRSKNRKLTKNRRHTGSSYYNRVNGSLFANNSISLNDSAVTNSNINNSASAGNALPKRSRMTVSGTAPGYNTPIHTVGSKPQGGFYSSVSFAAGDGEENNDENVDEDEVAFVEQQKRQQMIINAAKNALHYSETRNASTKEDLHFETQKTDGKKLIGGVDVAMQELINFSNKNLPTVSKDTLKNEIDGSSGTGAENTMSNKGIAPGANGLRIISEGTYDALGNANIESSTIDPMNVRHNTSVDGGSESGSIRNNMGHSRSNSRRRNSIILNNLNIAGGQPHNSFMSGGTSNMGFPSTNNNQMQSAYYGNNLTNSVLQSNPTNNNLHLANTGQTRHLNSVNMNNSSSSNNSILSNNHGINTFDLYDRLMKEKDLRIQQLEQEIELQRQETLWLRKMLMEDMGVVRSMLKDIKK